MGTIVEKLSYLNDTKDLFKDRLNSLGAEITSSTTFRNYLTWLDTFYNNVSDKTDLSVNGVVGRTSQETTTGKNLWNIIDYRDIDIFDNGSASHITTEDKVIITTDTGNYSGVYFANVYQNIDNYATSNTYYISFDVVANQNLTLLYGESGGIQIETTIGTQKIRLSQQYDPRKNMVFYSRSKRANDTIEISNVMISTSSDTTYEPYTYGASPNPDYPQPINNLSGNVPYKITTQNGEQTFTIPLGDIELGKITTYEDKIYSGNGRFYLKKNIGKVILDGRETWSIATNFWTASIDDYAYSNNIPYSNYFKGVINQQAATSLTEDNTFAFKNRSGEPRLYLKSSSFTTTTEFKNWLSTYKPIIYYALATPTTTEITQENYPSLYNALKQIQDYLTAYKINKEFILGYDSPEIEY